MAKFQRIVLIVLVALFIVIGIRLMPTHAAESRTLTVFAPSSLTDAFKELALAFQKSNPDVEIVFNFGASSTLATQIVEGAPADVFASANAKQMQVVADASLLDGEAQVFAHNRLILITPADNPAEIEGLSDLTKPGLKLVLAAPKVPVRDYTDAMLEKLAKSPDFGPDYREAVLKNVVSEEDNVRQVAAKVALGEADAGVVYASDVTPDIREKVQPFAIPDEVNTLASYPIAALSTSKALELARAFIEFTLSDAGQDILSKWGFISILEPGLTATQTAVPLVPTLTAKP